MNYPLFAKYIKQYVVIGALLAAPLALAATPDTNRPPEVSPIHAQLNPPTTMYSANATDPDGDTLYYEWRGDIGCGTFHAEFDSTVASWSHPNGKGKGSCPHDQGTSHPGTITLRVDDERGHVVVCTYQGSEDGNGDPCQAVESVVNDIGPKSYDSSYSWWYEVCYWLWLPLLLAAAILAWWLITNGLFVGRNDADDPCAKEKAAEAAARAKYEAAKKAFDEIDKAKKAADDLDKKARDAASAASAAARAAGGRWSADGSTDYQGEHIEVHKAGWQDKELGKKADDAAAKAKDAKDAATKAKSDFDGQGGSSAWQKAKSDMEAAKAAWEKASAALKVCLVVLVRLSSPQVAPANLLRRVAVQLRPVAAMAQARVVVAVEAAPFRIRP